ALAEMFNLARELNKATDPGTRRGQAAELLASGDLVGVLQGDVEAWFSGTADGALSGDEVDALLRDREQARGKRDFAAADAIRDRLAAAGISIEDGPSGTRWRRTG
ncbi:MAG: DALR domain-containing protein, partial [Woeseia sp.]